MKLSIKFRSDTLRGVTCFFFVSLENHSTTYWRLFGAGNSRPIPMGTWKWCRQEVSGIVEPGQKNQKNREQNILYILDLPSQPGCQSSPGLRTIFGRWSVYNFHFATGILAGGWDPICVSLSQTDCSESSRRDISQQNQSTKQKPDGPHCACHVLASEETWFFKIEHAYKTKNTNIHKFEHQSEILTAQNTTWLKKPETF